MFGCGSQLGLEADCMDSIKGKKTAFSLCFALAWVLETCLCDIARNYNFFVHLSWPTVKHEDTLTL